MSSKLNFGLTKKFVFPVAESVEVKKEDRIPSSAFDVPSYRPHFIHAKQAHSSASLSRKVAKKVKFEPEIDQASLSLRKSKSVRLTRLEMSPLDKKEPGDLSLVEQATPSFSAKPTFIETTLQVLTDPLLALRYERQEMLGHKSADDYTSMVVSVIDLQDSDSRKAIKVTIQKPSFELLKTIDKICQGKDTAHLIQTHLLGRVKVKSGAFLKTQTNDGFVYAPSSLQKLDRWAYVYEMKLMDGDLKSLKSSGLSLQELAAIEIQRVATESFLHSKGIIPSDLKDINVLFRTLSDEDIFNDKALLKVSFWKYRIGATDYYLPRLPYLITLCDYDEWLLSSIPLPEVDFEQVLLERLKHFPLLLKQIEEFKKEPEVPGRIAIMN
ncbi:MAG: hypothetical protein JSS60_02785 [Verrucomicrobia bacterium]|nr:hypothetical protein [Verrucomicrobiota bacterium]